MSRTKALVLLVSLAFVVTVALGVASSASDLIDRYARQRQEAHNLAMDRERLALDAARERQTMALAAERARLEQERARAQAAAPVATLSAMAWAALPLLGFVAAGAALSLFTVVSIDAYRQRRAPLVNVDGYPLPRSLLTSNPAAMLAAMDQRHERRLIVAQHAPPQPVPQTLHYAPHFSSSVKGELAAHAPDDAPAVVTVPSFAELVAGGAIGAGKPLVLGYTGDGPLVGNWRDLYSAAVAGMSGTGKTTTTRFLVCQSVLNAPDTRFLVLDPHGMAGDESLAGTLAPLARAFLAEPATDERAMLRLVRMAARELDQRLEGKSGPPWVLLCDEFTALMRGELAAPLAALIERIAQEGRKVQLYALLLGQVWKASRAGGTELRDSLASAYVHRTRPNVARLLLPNEDARRAEKLPTGAALLYRTNGEVVTVSIPNTTAQDVASVARFIDEAGGDEKAASARFAPASEPLLSDEAGDETEAAPEAAQVIHLLSQGVSQNKIIQEVWGVSGGAAYQQRAAQVSEIIKAFIRERNRVV